MSVALEGISVAWETCLMCLMCYHKIKCDYNSDIMSREQFYTSIQCGLTYGSSIGKTVHTGSTKFALLSMGFQPCNMMSFSATALYTDRAHRARFHGGGCAHNHMFILKGSRNAAVLWKLLLWNPYQSPLLFAFDQVWMYNQRIIAHIYMCIYKYISNTYEIFSYIFIWVPQQPIGKVK